MKLQTKKQELARKVSLNTLATVYARVAKHYDDLSKSSRRLEIVWFLKDKQGKIVKTGGCNKMAFRRNQLWRNFTDERHRKCTVNAIDMLSGIQVSFLYTEAMSYSTETLRNKVISKILGLC